MATNISLQAQNIIEFGDFHITNSVLGGTLTTFILLVIIILTAKKSKLVPTRLQLCFETFFSMFMESLIAAYKTKERAMKYLPFYVSLFIFLLIANQFSVIPLVNQIVTSDGDFLFKTATADFSQPITLAIFAIIGAHIIALSIAPLKHIGNFIKIGPLLKVRSIGGLANALLEIFLGLLDIVGEFAKFISISARLFGNVFAGEVMVVVIASLASWSAYILPIPFIVLSMFSGFVQAYVFAVLALQFTAVTVSSVEEDDEVQPEAALA